MMRDHALVTYSAAVIHALNEAEGALDEPGRVPEALDGLLATLDGLPQAETLLGAFVPGGWPNAEERRWLLFEALTAGEPVGKRPLRWIRQEDVVRAVAASRSAEEVGLRSALRSSREAVAEVIALRQSKAEPAAREVTGSKRASGGRKRRS